MPDREKVIKGLEETEIMLTQAVDRGGEMAVMGAFKCLNRVTDALAMLKAQEPDASKYQYKIDHTDCIWYSSDGGQCPSTCSQYRDGWNDAMDYIFKNGDGYKPYRRSVKSR